MRNLLTTGSEYIERSKQVYGRYQKYLPIAAFVSGFGWDSLTLNRIDRMIDNIVLLAYILILAIFLIILNLVEKERLKQVFFHKYREWYPSIIQFFIGGLFSAYVIFYFQSATFSKSMLFVILLFLFLVSNEFLKNRLTNLYLQMGIFFLVSFSFFVFFVPVVTKIMNNWTFLLSGLLSLGLVFAVIWLLWKQAAIDGKQQLQRVAALVGGLYLLLNLFYALNWIPPVPLSLKFAGMFHRVEKVDDRYQVTYEKPRWYQIFKRSEDTFQYESGDTVFCFASVFAPTALQTSIYHHWQKYLPESDKWQTTDRIRYPITGGRDGGYRGYSYKRYLSAGDWRVYVETEDRRRLGKISFEVTAEKTAGKDPTYKTVYR